MFWIEGRNRSLRRSARVAWFAPGERGALARGLDGEPSTIQRAMKDEVDGKTFRSTPTGPFYRADLDDPVAAFVQLSSYFLPGYTAGGIPPVPVDPVPEGAIP